MTTESASFLTHLILFSNLILAKVFEPPVDPTAEWTVSPVDTHRLSTVGSWSTNPKAKKGHQRLYFLKCLRKG